MAVSNVAITYVSFRALQRIYKYRFLMRGIKMESPTNYIFE